MSVEDFAWFATTRAKSRLNFLALLRAGATDYVINDEALAYMRGRSLSGLVIARLAGHKSKRLKDQEAWMAHLERLGITRLRVHPDPLKIATEGALWGSVVAHGLLLKDAVIVSDDAGQFNVGSHALCWVHAERLIHKLVGFNHRQRQACARIRARVWWFYADLKAYCRDPTPRRKRELQARFDRLFTTTTGFATLDRLLARLHANKIELLRALERPDIPLHTNGSENDIRCQVTRRKISGGTRSETGRDCRDAFLGLMKTCDKLGVSFWDYLGSRLDIPGAPPILPLARPHPPARRRLTARPFAPVTPIGFEPARRITLSRMTALTMVFKLCQSASKKWRRLDGSHQIADIIQGVKFQGRRKANRTRRLKPASPTFDNSYGLEL